MKFVICMDVPLPFSYGFEQLVQTSIDRCTNLRTKVLMYKSSYIF